VVVGFAVPFLIADHFGRTDSWSRSLMLFAVIGGGPLLAIAYGELLLAFANPEPGCTEECWGQFGLMVLALLGGIVWEAGVAFGGLHRYFRTRRGNPRETAARV
jgi:hypothetical protein